MRALVLRDYGKLVVETLPDPVPEEDEVLVRIVATGICGSDVHGYTGESGRREPGQVMGHETVGRVETVGSRVPPELRVGTVVTVNPVIWCGHCDACQSRQEQICKQRRVLGVDPTIQAAYAELVTVPARNVVPLSPSLPIEYGALVEPLAVGYHAVSQSGCGPGDRILITGGGPVGQACMLAARRAGALTVVSEPDPRRRELIGKLGSPTVNPLQDDVPAAATEQLGAPATGAIDAVGLTTSLADCLAATAPGSRIVLVGMHDQRLDIAAYAVSTEERAIIGSFCYSDSDLRKTAAWVCQAASDLAALIDARLDITEAPTAFAEAAGGHGGPGKVLLYPGGTPG